jgi:hypothetical protein
MKLIIALLLFSSVATAETKTVEESCKVSGYCCAHVFGKGFKCQYHFFARCDGKKTKIYENNRLVKETECKKK